MALAVSRPLGLHKPAVRTQARVGRRGFVPIRAAANDEKTSAPRLWVATISSSAPVLDPTTGSNLELTVVARDGEQRAEPVVVGAAWDRFEQNGGRGGWARRGLVPVPDGLGAPGAVLVRKIGDGSTDEAHSVDYIKSVRLATQEGVHEFPAYSWVAAAQGERVFYEGSAHLPQNTPAPLREARQQELEALRGSDGPSPKTNADRAYGYQVYDDLGTAKAPRPPLGGSADLPYPRHLCNNLAAGAQGPGKPWLPFDEQFDASKEQGFNGDLLKSIGPAIAQGVKSIDSASQFENFNDVLRLFRKAGPLSPGDGAPASAGDGAVWDLGLDDSSLDDLDDEVTSARLGPLGRLRSRLAAGVQELRSAPKMKDLLEFEAPRVLVGRGLEVVESDEEWGRQAVAGMNPCTLAALKQLPAQLGSAIAGEHVDEEIAALGGSSLVQHVADAAAGGKPRLFIIDYWLMAAFWEEAPADPPGRAEHAGRALLFLQQSPEGKEVALVPVAIELKHKQTHAQAAGLPQSAGVVYARQQLKGDALGQAQWWLAKAVFRSLDASYHQLISHWLRCHCCTEPYLLALRRNVSAMHPVFKLLLPHFRFTLDINSKARASLINAGGIIEDTFTPGPYAMRLSSAAYKSWRFHLQRPAADLEARGMLDGQGRPWLEDYPYGRDGLDIYAELEAYFGQYLRLYYASDADVAGDAELQAWWAEVKAKGHPDIALVEPNEAEVWGFAGPIPSVDVLAQVLATVAWVASAHHAAVNFGQYDYASLVLNAATLVRRPVPRPGDAADPANQALARAAASGGQALERELLTYVSGPLAALKEMVTVQLLSIHADGEQTLDERNWLLTDPAAVEANSRFMGRMQALEARIASRNADPASWARYGGAAASLAYTLLVPPSPAGLTFKGVPYSVSI